MTAGRVISLRYPGRCRACGAALARGQAAWWNGTERTLRCQGCGPADAGAPVGGEPPDAPGARSSAPSAPATDVAGHSAEAIWRRRHDAYKRRMDARWGRFAGVAGLLLGEPRSTTAWARGAAGERRVAAALDPALAGHGWLLNDRQMPGAGGNIDHVAVAQSGVWVVDAKNYRGRVQRRQRSSWFSADVRLVVAGHDRTAALDAVARQVAAVASVLDDPEVPLHAALCIVGAEWPWFARRFELREVLVTGPRQLARAVTATGPLGPGRVAAVHATLARCLPPC